MNSKKATSVDNYILTFPKATQHLLQQVRAAVIKAAPDAEELISYSMPAYKQGGALVYFADYAQHIGFYPTASGIKAFEKDLTKYKHSKGAVQFPLDQPLPLALITNMVKFKLKENKEKAKARKRT